eukprot:1161483-Pelagomonas_calceolata.AAC.1
MSIKSWTGSRLCEDENGGRMLEYNDGCTSYKAGKGNKRKHAGQVGSVIPKANTSTGLARSLELGQMVVGSYDLEKVCIITLAKHLGIFGDKRMGKYGRLNVSAPVL